MRAGAQQFIGQEEAIVGHLFWASVEIEIITVQIGATPVSGRMLAPDAETRTVDLPRMAHMASAIACRSKHQ